MVSEEVEVMARTTPVDSLPDQWRAAYERDRQGQAVYADPAPERRAGRMLAAFVVTGLAFLALPGTLLGVWNLITIAEHHAITAASTAWIQAHGHAQLFGWVGTFILGISLYTLPKFRGHALKRFGEAWTVWALWTLGVAGRWWAGFDSWHWRPALVGSALLELAAFALAQHILVWGAGTDAAGQPGTAGKKPSDLGSWLGIFGFASLGVALVINFVIAVELVRTSNLPIYPAAADRTFLLVALWGFTVPVAWGYSTRFVTIFLGLEPPVHKAALALGAGIALVVLLAIVRAFLPADLVAMLVTGAAIWALQVFRASVRPPKLLGVYRRYPAFIRVAYGWLVAGAVLGLAADLLPRASGLGGASRHAITVGFVATLIFAIGPRILPAFLSGRELFSARLMAASLWILNLGCLLRVSSEIVAYSSGGAAWIILPVSALLELTGVVIFVVNLGATLTQPMPAWFPPEGANARLPVYWYVTSFPKTRAILIESGLETLARVRDVPRSLSLGEAVAADGADLDQTLARLREFFRQRQPRRTGR